MTMRNYYTLSVLSHLGNSEALLYTYADYQLEAMDIWAQGSDECSMPTINLSTEETSDCTTVATDISSYVSQQALKWMVGEEALTDESWESYKNQLKNMGISGAVEIYQGAYDRMYK